MYHDLGTDRFASRSFVRGHRHGISQGQRGRLFDEIEEEEEEETEVSDDMHQQLQIRSGEAGSGAFRDEGGHRGQQLEPLLDGLERQRGTGQGHEEVPESQPLPRNDGDLQEGFARAEPEPYAEALPKGLQFLPEDLVFPSGLRRRGGLREAETLEDLHRQARHRLPGPRNLLDQELEGRQAHRTYDMPSPFLVDGYKFDLRIYALITSCDPLRVYVYNDGLARFATSRYKEPNGHNTSNVFMHLTNYAVNKHSRMYVIDEEVGSKRKISTLNKWLRTKDVDVNELCQRIDEIIIKTISAAYPILKHSYHTCFPTHDKTYACFELLGFDVLIDWKLKPYLLEVNHSPSFHTDAQIDKDIKEGLLMDTFAMLNLQQCDKKKIIEEDRKRVRDRLLQGISCKEASTNDATAIAARLEKPEEDFLERQFQWEDEHMGNFRRIYPCAGLEKYDSFFKQNSISVFQDTVASRAREEASRIQKEESEVRPLLGDARARKITVRGSFDVQAKLKEQESKKMAGKSSDSKLHPESPNVAYGHKSVSTSSAPSGNREGSRSAAAAKRRSAPSNTKKQPANTLYSFEPEIICESEERERVTALAQRDFLIKSYGMLEQIYMAMKRNGTLRPIDEKKYGLYGRLGYKENGSNAAALCRQKSYRHQQNAMETDYSAQYSLKGRAPADDATITNTGKAIAHKWC
ncbi:tubulin polyglutamylase TTLL13-like isoform X3 [Nomia melanderi]|uniref:tubulin polyglutamylase TTLL13-like isoform X3 n=1 Tax=Nomia melanderi TaxID=2448451 RepID=UPI003FCDD662